MKKLLFAIAVALLLPMQASAQYVRGAYIGNTNVATSVDFTIKNGARTMLPKAVWFYTNATISSSTCFVSVSDSDDGWSPAGPSSSGVTISRIIYLTKGVPTYVYRPRCAKFNIVNLTGASLGMTIFAEY